jgi:hypothetical protein
MSRQLAVWGPDSDVYVLRDDDLTTIVVNKSRPNTYQYASESRAFDKLVELSVSGYKVPQELFAAGVALVGNEMKLD